MVTGGRDCSMSTIILNKPSPLTGEEIRQKNLPGASQSWVADLREASFKQYERLGIPTPRMEDWKYTNLKSLQRQKFQFSTENKNKVTENEISAAIIPGLDMYKIVFVDGVIDYTISKLQGITCNVKIASLGDQLSTNNKDLKLHLGKHATPDLNGFVSLNTALMRDGIYIHLLENAIIDKPIHLIYISTTQNTSPWFHLRNLIIAEPNSQAVVVESYVGFSDSVYFNNITTEISLEQNANITHYKIQQEAKQAFHVALIKILQNQGSHFSSYSLSIGGKLSRNEIQCDLSAPGCECILNGLYLANERQQVDTVAKVDHKAVNGTSRVFFKGIENDKAKAIFRGAAYVHPNAQQTDAEQKNNNLLLSPNAEVDTKPQLEIYANDVKCSHGATVGQLDEDELFYLRSRGIDENTARGLLTYSFAKEIIDDFPLTSLAQHADFIVKNKLPGTRYLDDFQ